MTDNETPVLIVGGGLVGLSSAMFLAQHGIPSVTLERLRGGSPLPRAAHFHLRTLELFRSAGIEDEVRQQSEREFLPEGALVMMGSLAGPKIADVIPGLNEGVAPLSPSRRLFITQPGLEPILRRRAEAEGTRVLEGYEVTALAQDESGVTVTAKSDKGEETFRAKYVVGADGGHSRVRELLGIPMDGRGVFSNSITIYFHADLSPQVGGKPISVIYINNPAFGGFFRLDKDCKSGFLAVNTIGDPKTNPDVANAAKDTSPARLIELVRIGAGVPDLAVTIDGVARWRATSDVARRYQDGRIFIAGDAAHLMPPNGGFGGNTGIHDAHNLAWKLALALKGVAAPSLLATYEAERKPVGKFTVEQAYTRYVTRTATYLGATDFQPPVADFNIELGPLYHSDAVLAEDDGQVHGDPRETRGKPGSRAPHLWVESGGTRVSTLDLFGSSFVLLAGPDGAAWCDAARNAASRINGLKVAAYCIGGDLRDPDGSFAAAYGLTSSGAVLVRPDGYVAWRMESLARNAEDVVTRALQNVLGH